MQRLLVGAIRSIPISILSHNVFYLLQDIRIRGFVCACLERLLECSYRISQFHCHVIVVLLGCRASVFYALCLVDCIIQGILCSFCRKSNALRDVSRSLEVYYQDFCLIRCRCFLIIYRVIKLVISRLQRVIKRLLIQRACLDRSLECSHRFLQCICRVIACLLGCKASFFCVICLVDCSLQGILCSVCRKSNAFRDVSRSLAVYYQDFCLILCGFLLKVCQLLRPRHLCILYRRYKLLLIQRVYGYFRRCGQCAAVGIAAGYGYGGHCRGGGWC